MILEERCRRALSAMMLSVPSSWGAGPGGGAIAVARGLIRFPCRTSDPVRAYWKSKTYGRRIRYPASGWSFAPRYAICDMPMAFLLVSSFSFPLTTTCRMRIPRRRRHPVRAPPRVGIGCECGKLRRRHPHGHTPPKSSGRVEDRSRSAGAGIQLHGR